MVRALADEDPDSGVRFMVAKAAEKLEKPKQLIYVPLLLALCVGCDEGKKILDAAKGESVVDETFPQSQ